MGEPGKLDAQRKKPVTVGHMMCDSICTKCPEEPNAWKCIEIEGQLMGLGGKRGWECLLNGYGISIWGDGNVLELHRGDAAQHSQCAKCQLHIL